MFSFMKRHKVAYAIAIVLALALGFGLAYVVGVKGSTPEAERSEHISQEQQDVDPKDEMAGPVDQGGGPVGAAVASDADLSPPK